MALQDVMAAMKAGGIHFVVDVSPDAGNPYRANIGDATQAFVEQGNLADLLAVEAFFRAQCAIYFPNVVLPS